MHFSTEQLTAMEIVRKAGFEPRDAVVLCDNSRKYKTDVVSVPAIKDDENYNLYVSTKKSKILSIDLIVVQWFPNEQTGEFTPRVKRFSRAIK